MPAGRPKSSDREWVEHTSVIDVMDLRESTGYPDWLQSASTVTLTLSHPHGPTLTPVGLVRTFPNYGGVRYWFACPRCRRRVRKLYASGSDPQLACRKCHGLVYGLQYQKALSYAALHWALNDCRGGGSKKGKRAIAAWAACQERGEEFRWAARVP